ncbi:MAG: DUF1858 domain-containing protein [Deltaproteobacteria bacterium]|nr:DUF1858 domain-containing protein [Deltaproteobacteria bacterium]
MAKITEATKINEMIKKYPETRDVLKKYQLDCFGCMGAEQESVRNAAWSHGLDVDGFVEELNKALGKK